MEAPSLTLVGRSSSHFTRLTRIFLHELGVPYAFQVVKDLRAVERDAYAGNPALRVPLLITATGTWIGSVNICREVARRAPDPRRVLWPEQLQSCALANLQELTLQAMSTEVELIMNDAPSGALATKRRAALEGMMAWLDENVEPALAELPERDLSYVEAALYCLVTHLEFRQVLSTAPYARLLRFADGFGKREGAVQTSFRFD